MSNAPQIAISCVSSVYVRQMHFLRAGDREKGHAHTFDHQTLLAKGSVRVSLQGKASTFHAPHILFIRKGIEHELTALEDDTLCYCIHALRTQDEAGEIIDPESIPFGAGSAQAFEVAAPLVAPQSPIPTAS
ncbi:MAG: hypothetical protein EB072_12125 [Betaproteobacteria bacterium]|nr:hypothetical protein [Betaproteobacteria bacterium]